MSILYGLFWLLLGGTALGYVAGRLPRRPTTSNIRFAALLAWYFTATAVWFIFAGKPVLATIGLAAVIFWWVWLFLLYCEQRG